MLKKGNIVITLKSDLCVSSGYSFAGAIDMDVCYDTYGLPYIPAKRIKGVIREAAELIDTSSDSETVDSIFGKGGASTNGALKINDALLENASELEAYLMVKELNTSENKDSFIKPQDVLNLFSSVKAQTRINENGVADDNSLRFTRVINEYLPKSVSSEQKEVRFVAPIIIDSEYEEQFRRILKAVRHMGMDRTRGLGNIRCELKDVEAVNNIALNPSGDSCNLVQISFTLKNLDQLMISGEKDFVSESYIPGSNVLGALAGAYLKQKGISEPDEVFSDIFLSGKTTFGNLYISNSIGESFVPAPLYINKLKKTEKYVSVTKEYIPGVHKASYDPDNGNQPKKLNGKYVSLSSDSKVISVLEPKTDIIYHHSRMGTYDEGRRGDKSDSILYTMEVIEKGQYFSGSIIVEERYAEILKGLLENLSLTGELRFGKSKSAQYGRCKLVGNLKSQVITNDKVKISKDSKVFVVMDSDAIISGEYGYTVDYESVLNYIARETGLETLANPKVYMNTKTVTGYNAKINLKKSSMPAIKAGSAFEFTTLEDKEIDKIFYIGSYIAEGFGKAHIVKADDISYALEYQNDSKTVQDNKVNNLDDYSGIEKEIAAKLLLDEIKADFLRKNKEATFNGISASLTGRVALMLKESRSSDDALKDFAKRIKSIKRVNERTRIIDYLKKWNVCVISPKPEVSIKVENLKKLGNSNIDKLIKVLDNEMIAPLWTDYLAFILTIIKYGKSNKN